MEKMEEILKALGIDKLDESQKDAVTEKLQTIIDMKVNEKVKDQVDSKLDEEKEKLLDEYNTKFDEYKEKITEEFSNFLDGVLEEEIQIPEMVLEWAKKGQIYSDIIEQLKIRIGIDEGVLDDTYKETLEEAATEIEKNRSEINELVSEKLELESDTQKMAAQLYIYEKCEELPYKQRVKIMENLDGVLIKEDIDKKFDSLMGLLSEADGEEENGYDCECPECGATTTSKDKCSLTECPECGAKMTDAGEGKGSSEAEEDDKKKKEKIDESQTITEQQIKRWSAMIGQKKF